MNRRYYRIEVRVTEEMNFHYKTGPQPPPYDVTTSLSIYEDNLPIETKLVMSRALNIGDVKFYELLILFVRWGEIECGIASTVDILARPHNEVLFPKVEGQASLYSCIQPLRRSRQFHIYFK